MRKNELMIGDDRLKAKVAIQSAYKEGDKFVANVGLGMINETVCWFECVWTPSYPVTVATGKHLSLVADEIAMLKQFIKDNAIAIKEFAETL
jgi:hypothetical protein